ncbi:MAG: hypothetical protein ACI9UN_004481 [Granulosicoccus sp.]
MLCHLVEKGILAVSTLRQPVEGQIHHNDLCCNICAVHHLFANLNDMNKLSYKLLY